MPSYDSEMRFYFLVSIVLLSISTAYPDPKPKYGPSGNPRAIPLSRDHSYFLSPEHPAPDFWALIPYYVGQKTEASCSVAAVTALVNAARAAKDLNNRRANEKLVTDEELLARVQVASWEKKVGADPNTSPKGVTLDQLAKIAKAALETNGVKVRSAEILRFQGSLEGAKRELRRILSENERSARDFILVNFFQKSFTDDAPVGHIAPLGAYDGRNERVLILDPDREWYEPYWVSLETLLTGMKTTDGGNSGMSRGLVWLKLN
ncbi:MAG: hypothetical protein A2603_11210 [Bdellovibrionales bacterium RIFOXYD1_FULL_55_31]|nr:MAG: hypothetical protein A2603_11210 [Bdellovibrionales bacterium RIFOXYD1_FULL_55_31]